jgi:phage baseplate assembly protein W
MPWGVGPWAMGTPALAAESPERSLGSRYLNPLTRDYELSAISGNFAQMPIARQKVLLALLTPYGSSTAAPRFGLRVPSKITSRFESELRANVRSALAHLTREDGAIIEIESIMVEVVRPGAVVLTVSYTDLTTGEPDTATARVA